MIATVAVVVALLSLFAVSRRWAFGGVVVALFLLHPLLGLAAGAGIAMVVRIASMRAARSDDDIAAIDGLAAIELVGLGVSAGLPFRNAAALSADQLGGATARHIEVALRNIGAGQPVSIPDGDVSAMFAVAAASEHSGMPLGEALNALSRDSRREVASKAKERLSKLPVKMLFPLALLILPGFVLLTVVPPLVSGLSRLSL